MNFSIRRTSVSAALPLSLTTLLVLHAVPAIPKEFTVVNNASLLVGERRVLTPLADGTILHNSPYDGVPDF